MYSVEEISLRDRLLNEMHHLVMICLFYRFVFVFVFFCTTNHQVKAGTPAQGVLLRGDIIVKIQDYDARDIRNIDAQTLFRSAGNRIKIVVQRDSKLIVSSNMSNDASRSPSAVPPYRSDINLMHYDFNEAANLLPQSPFQAISDNGSSRPNSRLSNFSPMPTRDHQQEVQEEIAAITSQVIAIP